MGGLLSLLCFVTLLGFLCIQLSVAVDHSKFQTCQQSASCRRYRRFVEERRGSPQTQLPTWKVESTPTVTKGVLVVALVNSVDAERRATMRTKIFTSGIVSVVIDDPEDDLGGVRPGGGDQPRRRYRVVVDDVMMDSALERQVATNVVLSVEEEKTTFSAAVSTVGGVPLAVAVEVRHNPWQLRVFANGNLLQTVNAEGLFNFERCRPLPPSPSPSPLPQEDENNATTTEAPPLKKPLVDAVAVDSDGVGEDWFGGHKDVKPRGPCAVGWDVTFEKASHAYGLAEHSSPLDLPAYDEPYRFFNLDVFEYDLNSSMAVYGAVPLLMAPQASSIASAMLWVNPSETWVKLENAGEGKKTWWISETGVLEAWFFLGPTLQDVYQQYHVATGLPQIPPLYALGKHQCRWNYNDEDDVAAVSRGFNEYDIPMDVMWLDIEHTDNRKYFTWHPRKFPTPLKMVEGLEKDKRKLVVIVDPHLKAEKEYPVHSELQDLGLLVKKEDGTSDYEGWCWSGTSTYPDFTNPETRNYWASQFINPRWPVSQTPSMLIWNDMNEPSVFNGPEVSMPRNCIHMNNVEHREVHNLYGIYTHRATFEGLLRRQPNLRPFVLTRSFFIGSHRYGAVWTGDNKAEWSHLRVSVPMCLTHALSGISFIGADVSGFFGNPDDELFTRWHQIGAWYPFYRAHAHIESKRREPWEFPEDTRKRVRRAVQLRYRLLPEIYAAFALYAFSGMPIMRPIWWTRSGMMLSSDACPDCDRLYSHDDSFMFGDNILVHSVYRPMNEITEGMWIPLPAHPPAQAEDNSEWYDLHTGVPVAPGNHSIMPSMDNIPVFIRAGSIIPTWERQRRSAEASRRDPLTLHVYTSSPSLSAWGRVYLDDFESWDFANQGDFLSVEISFSNSPDGLVLQPASFRGSKRRNPRFPNAKIERVVVWGLPSPPTSVSSTASPSVDFAWKPIPVIESMPSRASHRVDIKKPGIDLDEAKWQLVLRFK